MSENDPSPDGATEPRRSLLELWTETSLVLLVCVAPLLLASTAAAFIPHAPGPFLYDALYTVLQSAGSVALVPYVVTRSGEPPERFGLRRFHPAKDLLGGVGTFVLGMAAFYLLWIVLSLTLNADALTAVSDHDLSALSVPSGATGYVALVVMSLANGLREEVVMRAYLIPRFEQLFGGTGIALLLSTALFTSYHSYQGPAGAISAGALGLVYGAIFCLSRRLWPVALAHAFQDILSIATMS